MALLHHTETPGLVSRTVEAAVRSLDSTAATALLSKLLKEDTVSPGVVGRVTVSGQFQLSCTKKPLYGNPISPELITSSLFP